jgi:hypothetical protein
MKKQLLILTSLFLSLIGYSQTFTNNFITYNITSSNTVEVSNYNFANGGVAVTIPATIVYNSITYNVTKIGDSAFKNYGITSVSIANSVNQIANYAFQNCSLTTVNIPNSVLSMGVLCFMDNTQLVNVTLSASLTSIPVGAFANCAITSVTIPNNVTDIGLNAFRNNQLTSIVIPINVMIISNGVFYGNPLTNVTSVRPTPPAATKDLVNDSFSSNRSNITLTIPIGSTSAYNIFTWTGFASVTESTLSNSNFELGNDIKVISNANSINIISSNNAILENYTLYNISGAKVATGTENKFNTNTFASGIYILNVTFDKGFLSKKVIIN